MIVTTLDPPALQGERAALPIFSRHPEAELSAYLYERAQHKGEIWQEKNPNTKRTVRGMRSGTRKT